MFGQPTSQHSSLATPLIGLAISAGGVLLSAGLCGVAESLHESGGLLSSLGVGVFFLSLLGILVSILWFIVVAIARAFQK